MFRYLLWAALVGAPLITASAAETVWWRTAGATVIQTGNTCSLYFVTNPRAAIFTWKPDGSKSVAFQDERFHFDTVEQFAVGMRIDDIYLTDDLIGNGNGDLMTVGVEQPLEKLLMNASEVQVRAANGKYDVTVPLIKAKMPALLTAVGKCRAVLRH